jgi:hypothetical protein
VIVVRNGVDFLSECPEDVVLAAAVVGEDLSWQDRILGDVCQARVFVEREEEKPDYSDQNADDREVGWELEEDG